MLVGGTCGQHLTWYSVKDTAAKVKILAVLGAGRKRKKLTREDLNSKEGVAFNSGREDWEFSFVHGSMGAAGQVLRKSLGVLFLSALDATTLGRCLNALSSISHTKSYVSLGAECYFGLGILSCILQHF